MGWMTKLLAFLVAIMLFGVGAWQLTLLIFAVLFIPPILKARKGKTASQDKGRALGRFPVRKVVGAFLFLLAFAAYLAHGTVSPFVFASVGLLVMVWGTIPISVLGSRLKPVEESILLRSSPLPVSWAAVAEVKPLTRDLGRAMAGVTGTVLVSASETPSVYVVVERRAAGERSAEDAILSALKETAFSLSSLGAYLLPLDSTQAAALFQPSLEASKFGEGDLWTALASGTYDVLSIRQERGFAKSVGLYRRVDQGREGRARIPLPPQDLKHPLFLAELFKAVGARLVWPSPDQYTAFLSSLLATSGEPVGTRILDAGAGSQSQMVMVKSQGSPSVELSRAQLRAVVRMYDKGGHDSVRTWAHSGFCQISSFLSGCLYAESHG